MLNGNVTPSDANSDNAGLASGTIDQLLAHRRTRAATAALGHARSPLHDPGTVWTGRHSTTSRGPPGALPLAWSAMRRTFAGYSADPD